jgi:aminoglycoside phosphotransferase (APT) family kinase protein
VLDDYLRVIGHGGHGDSSLHRGQFHDVVITPAAVYRFPRTESARAGLGRTVAVLSALAGVDLGFVVPEPLAPVDVTAPLGRCHLVTTRVPGGPLPQLATDHPDHRVPAGELTRLLAALRGAGADPAVRRAVPVAEASPDRWHEFAAQVEAVLFPRMSRAGRQRAARELVSVTGLPHVTSALVHGDLGGGNLLWRWAGERPVLAGVVDWDGAVIGDPAADVASLAVTWSWPTVIEALTPIEPSPEPLLARARAIAGTFALQQALPAALDGDMFNLREGLAGYRA